MEKILLSSGNNFLTNKLVLNTANSFINSGSQMFYKMSSFWLMETVFPSCGNLFSWNNLFMDSRNTFTLWGKKLFCEKLYSP